MDVTSAPLLWLSGHSTVSLTILKTNRANVLMPDIPDILLEHFIEGSRTITKLQRGVSSSVLVFYTIESLPNAYLGATPTVAAPYPLTLDMMLSMGADNPSYPNKGPLDFQKTIRIDAWNKVKELEPTGEVSLSP
jgi:hypothetical protein